MIVQAFVLVEGSGVSRAELVKAFYDLAGAGAEPGAYPQIVPSTMASLEEQSVKTNKSGKDGTVIAFRDEIHRTFSEISSIATTPANAEAIHFRMPPPDIIRSRGELLKSRYPVPR